MQKALKKVDNGFSAVFPFVVVVFFSILLRELLKTFFIYLAKDWAFQLRRETKKFDVYWFENCYWLILIYSKLFKGKKKVLENQI